VSALPAPRPAPHAALKRFDARHGLPAALGVLRRSLRPLELARVLGAMALGSARDPLRRLSTSPQWSADAEALVRHQLRAAVRLDDATRRALRGPAWPEARRQGLLLDVIAATGSRFIEHNVPFPTREDWRGSTAQARQAFIEALRGRLFNAQLTPAGVEADAVGFDVNACRFVELCQELGRPHLAAMFCEADSRFFAEHTDLIELRRSRTQARDGEPCDFRFTLRG
jgi:hypothetical protein